jgi:hypothetical protein
MELALSERLLGILRGGKSVSFKDREEVGSSTPPAKCVQTIFSGGAGCQQEREVLLLLPFFEKRHKRDV